MASSATNFFLLLLVVALSSAVHTHARDSQSFNKIPSTATSTTTNVVKIPNGKKEQPNNQQQDPTFLPDNESAYGLYGHESGQLPPATTTNGDPTTTKYLPKNYNPVAYVTEPEDTTTFTENSYTTDPNNYGGGRATGSHSENYYRTGGGNYYNSPQENTMKGYRRNSYYNNINGDNFNEQPQGLSDTSFMGGETSNHGDNLYTNGGDLNNVQRKGMSDTRFLENGKYYYDVNREKYSSNHPYESLKGIRARNEYRSRNYYGNNENSYRYNNAMDEFQNQDEYQEGQDEEADMP